MTAPVRPMTADPDKLRAARALIAKPGGWTQGAMARDVQTRKVKEKSQDAICFCSASAIFVAGGGYIELHTFCAANNIEIVSRWNDAPERTQAEVIAAFDRAIAKAESDRASQGDTGGGQCRASQDGTSADPIGRQAQ